VWCGIDHRFLACRAHDDQVYPRLSRLSLADIDELARLRKILCCSMLLDQLFEGEQFGKVDEAQDWTVGDVRMRDALADLLDDITEGSQRTRGDPEQRRQRRNGMSGIGDPGTG
jgi:hypothetical protein